MTPVSDFRELIRLLLGDTDDEVAGYAWPDRLLDSAVRQIVRGGQVTGYSLTQANRSVTPDVTANTFMLVGAKAAQLLTLHTPEVVRTATRAWKEETQSRERRFDLAHLIYQCENGTMFEGWSNLATWVEGMSGLNAWNIFTRLNISTSSHTTVDVSTSA